MQLARFSVLLAVLVATSCAYVAHNSVGAPAGAPATISQVKVAQSSALPALRANLNQGVINVGDRLLYSVRVARYAIVNTIQYQDILYRGNATNRISAVFATEQGASQNASAWIIAGGLGATNVTVRLQSLAGRGYDYNTQIWGR